MLVYFSLWIAISLGFFVFKFETKEEAIFNTSIIYNSSQYVNFCLHWQKLRLQGLKQTFILLATAHKFYWYRNKVPSLLI